jgi:hypothetical protein
MHLSIMDNLDNIQFDNVDNIQLNYIRRICSIIDIQEILIYSLFGGASGSIMFPDDPFYGFSLFAWTIIIMYVIIIAIVLM